MTDYEFIDAFVLHMNLVQMYFISFISATSAFLVVAHLAAKELPATMVRLAIGLYVFTSIYFLANFQRAFSITIAVRERMVESNLTWYPAVSEPQWVMPSVMWIGASVMLVLSIVSIWYFISSQKKIHNQNQP